MYEMIEELPSDHIVGESVRTNLSTTTGRFEEVGTQGMMMLLLSRL